MFSSWLDKIALLQNQISLQAAEQDNTFPVLLELLEQGYDMVSWVTTDHEPACELCQYYNNHKTTWRLSEFLGLTRASLERGIHIIAAPLAWEELDDSDKLSILRTPMSAYKYAKSLGFKNIPSEVIEEISRDLIVSEYFTEGFLDINTEKDDKLPDSIVNTIANDASFVERLARDKEKQPNFPKDLKQFRGRTKEEVALEDQKNFNATLLRYNAPLFEHSHCNCACQLMVWKSKDPSNVVYVDAAGSIK